MITETHSEATLLQGWIAVNIVVTEAVMNCKHMT